MKILLITYRVPYPAFSGERLRVLQLLQLLKKKNEVFLITFVTSQDDIKNLKKLEDMGINTKYVFLNVTLAKIKAFLCLFLFPNTPIQVSLYTNHKMKSSINEIIRDENIDLTYTFLARMGKYFIPNSVTLQILDYMDAFSEYYVSRASINQNYFSSILDAMEGKRLKKWEQKLLKTYDFTTIISPHDSSIISRTSPPMVIPTHVDDFLNYKSLDNNKLTTFPSIIFFGEMSTYYSESAILYIVNEVLPIVWGKIPSLKLYLVGSSPTEKIKKLMNDRIIVTGYVEDIREYIASADISIVPVFMGSGLKNKIIQSMALKVPVIANSIANIGIQAEHKKHLLIANTSQDFAKSILYLLDNPKEKQNLVDQAFDFVQENFSGNYVMKQIETLIGQIEKDKK